LLLFGRVLNQNNIGTKYNKQGACYADESGFHRRTIPKDSLRL